MSTKIARRRLRSIATFPTYDPAIVTVVSEILKQAKRGEIVAIAIATVNIGGMSSSAVTLAPTGSDRATYPITMLGEIECMGARLRDKLREINGGAI